MLDEALKSQLKELFQKLDRSVTLRCESGAHPARAELREMLNAVAAQSEWIQITEAPGDNGARFALLADGEETGVVFQGVPGGHEFSSLVLAILQAGGATLRLDEGLQQVVRSFDEPLNFETFVSLDCHNCPDVVQTLNSFALLNPQISNVMIDGALFPELVAARRIQGVPAVFLNGQPFSNGKIDASQIVDKLLAQTKRKASAPADVSGPAKRYDVAIIGGGPAGVAAAVYSARKGLKVAVVADRIGGQVRDTLGIENLISIPRTTGPELSAVLTEQLQSHGVDVRSGLRVNALRDGETKAIELNTGEILEARTVIIASGAKWRELNVPGEKENIGAGVAFCPHCDGPFFKGKDVAVVGGGNSGVEAALDLAGIVKSVHVIEFGPRLNADQTLLDRLARTENIRVTTSAQTTEVLAADGRVVGLAYKDRDTDAERKLTLDGVFVQIGLIPNSAFVKGLLEMNRMGEIIVDEKCRTNVPGVFACGDVTTTPYKQIAIAVGEGAKASLSAFEHLMKLPQPALSDAI